MRAYSEDPRRKVIEALQRGISKAHAAHLFGISISSVKRYARMARRGRPLSPRKGTGRPPKIDERAAKLLEEDVKERPAAAVAHRRRFLEHFTGEPLSDSTVRRLLKRLGFSRKRTVGAMERDEWLRAAWKVMVAGKPDARRLVFVDEMGTNTSLSAPYGWAPKGERACWSVPPRNRGPNTTLLASMSPEGMGRCLAVIGPTTREVFEAYVEKVLAPSLRGGRIVVMDNLSAHEGPRVGELIEERGCELLYLAPYPPDLNPIEEAFAKNRGPHAESRGSHPRDPGRGDGHGDLGGRCS